MAVEVGDRAPDFELKDQHGTPVRLSSFRGAKNVVLVWNLEVRGLFPDLNCHA